LLNYLTGLDIGWVVAPALPMWASGEQLELAPGVAWPSGLLLFITVAFSCGLLSYVAWRSAWAWWRSGEPVHLYLLLYLGLLLPWPLLADLGGRFLWPVAPLLAWYLGRVR
jgi:hypothetical protein